MNAAFWSLLVAAVVLGLSSPSLASLGGEISSVKKDQARLKASLTISSGDRYSLHEMKAPTGTVVREYASSDGKVFAVAWEGPWRPDLRQLLGDYFSDFQQSAKNRRRGHNGPLVSATPRLVIEMNGRPRAFYGRAYVPDLVPSSVQPSEIR